jgi:hypothetical protein
MSEERLSGIEFQGVDAASRFVDLLAGSPSAKIAFRTFPDAKTGTARPRKLYGPLPEVEASLQEAQDEGCGVFAVINEGGDRDAEISNVRAVFIDADGASLKSVKWHLKPDMITGRSDTNWHAYWLVDGVSSDQFVSIQKRLAKYYGTDPNVSNLSRVMRVPGFLHLKAPTDPHAYKLIDLTDGSDGGIYRELNACSSEYVCKGLPPIEDETRQGPPVEKQGQSIAFTHLQKMLSFIEPTMKGEHAKWAGMTHAILHDLPLEPADTVACRRLEQRRIMAEADGRQRLRSRDVSGT